MGLIHSSGAFLVLATRDGPRNAAVWDREQSAPNSYDMDACAWSSHYHTLGHMAEPDLPVPLDPVHHHPSCSDNRKRGYFRSWKSPGAMILVIVALKHWLLLSPQTLLGCYKTWHGTHSRFVLLQLVWLFMGSRSWKHFSWPPKTIHPSSNVSNSSLFQYVEMQKLHILLTEL